MGNKVVKFGGSSLADANQFVKVANIIKSDSRRKKGYFNKSKRIYANMQKASARGNLHAVNGIKITKSFS